MISAAMLVVVHLPSPLAALESRLKLLTAALVHWTFSFVSRFRLSGPLNCCLSRVGRFRGNVECDTCVTNPAKRSLKKNKRSLLHAASGWGHVSVAVQTCKTTYCRSACA